MRSLPIDTHRLAKRLEEAGFSQAQIEAQLEVLSQMVSASDLATKADLRRLALRFKKELRLTEAKLHKEIAESEAHLRKDMQELEARLRSEIEKSELRLRAEITQSQNRVIFWVAGLLLAQGALYLTLQKLFQLLP